MSKLYRSMLWSGLVVAGVAACGDDVSIVQPPPPVLTVHSISVAPNGVTVGIGANVITMSAAVNADAGVTDLAVVWSTSDAAKATVSQTGQVTTLAAGSVAIIACSHLAPSVCGNATLTIAVNAPVVTGVTVTPSSASFVVGQPPVTFVASVQGTNSPAQTVTWSTASGTSTVVSVGAATGVVTVVGAGTEVVKACATAAPTVCGSSSVSVQVAAPTQVSIQGITQGGTTNPVTLSNVSGQVDVLLNVDPGAGSLVKVQVLIDGEVVAEQCFIALCPASIRAEMPAENAVQAVTLSLNTAQVKKLANNLYIPVAFNGPRNFSAKLFTSLTTSGLSSNVIPVVLQNQNALLAPPAFVLAAATPANTAPGNVVSGGAPWFKGNVTFTGGNYVSFFPVTPASATWTSTGGCSASGNSISGAWNTGLTFSGSWTCGSSVEGAVNLGALTVTPGTAPAADFVNIPHAGFSQVGTAYVVKGENRYNLLPGGSAPAPTSIWIDNKAPTIVVNEIGFVAGCSTAVGFPVPGCWVNGTYNLAGDFVASDAGSNTVVKVVSNWVSTVLGVVTCGATSYNLATLPEDPSATKYDACVTATDALGNASTARGNNVFGLDRTNPTITYTGTYATTLTVANAVPAATIDYSVNDNNSGLDDNALTLSLTTLLADAAPLCYAGSNPNAPTTTAITATLAPGPAGSPRSMLAPIASPDNVCGDQGYYTWTASVTDRAGNSATPAAPNNPIKFALDRTAPEIQTVAPQPLYAANQNANFLVFATDSTDLAGVQIDVRYNATGGTLVDLRYKINSGFGTVWDNVLTRITTPATGFPAVIPGSQVFGSFVIDTTVTLGGPADVLQQANVTAFDFFPNFSAPFLVPIPAVYKDNAQFPLAGAANPWATTGIFAGATFSGAGACTYTYDTPSNGPTIPTRVLVANQIAAGPPILLEILSEITTTGTGLNVGDNPILVSDNGTFRRYRYSVSASTCAALQGAGTLRLIAVKGTGPGLSAYLVP